MTAHCHTDLSEVFHFIALPLVIVGFFATLRMTAVGRMTLAEVPHFYSVAACNCGILRYMLLRLTSLRFFATLRMTAWGGMTQECE